MYLPGFGFCSSIIHLVASHPKIAAAIGVSAVVGVLVSPVGPGAHLGSEAVLSRAESEIVKSSPEIEKIYPQILISFEEIKSWPISDEEIKHVLNMCEKCTDIDVGVVRADSQMLEDVKFLYYLDLVNKTKSVKAARKTLTQRPN